MAPRPSTRALAAGARAAPAPAAAAAAAPAAAAAAPAAAPAAAAAAPAAITTPKSVWGPRGWRWLHTMAIAYPRKPSKEDKLLVQRRLTDFFNALPCPECRAHAAQYLARHPPDITDSATLQAWTWRFHNFVNARLGKPAFPFSAYQQMYLSEMCWAHWPSAGCESAF